MTIVTVVFEPEIPLLKLQARSFARYLAPEVSARILVIDNTARGMREKLWGSVLAEYGPFASMVELVRADSVSGLPRATGWNLQQVLKLAVARLVATDRYLTLDAKNHLIRRTTVSDLEATDGRPLGNFHSYASHPLKPAFERVMRFAGLDPESRISRFTSTATPFILYSPLVRDLLDDVEARSGRDFATEFIRARLTEYFFYSAWLTAHGYDLDELYDSSGIPCPAVWPKGANVAGVQRALSEIAERDPAMISVHRTALARMDRRATSMLEDLWLERGLFRNRTEVTTFVRTYRVRYVVAMIMKKLRERGLGG